MSDEVAITIERDAALEQRMLEAVIADRNSQPRNQQIMVGPSSIGFCRELLRAQLFEAQSTNVAQEENWAAAAHVGSVVGADLERIFGARLGALEQQRVTAMFETIGVHISGAMDLVFLDDGQVTDLKSTTDIGGLLYDLNKNAQIIETLLSLWREGRLFSKIIETPDGEYELTDAMLKKFSKLHYYVQIAIYVVGAIQTGILDEDGEGRLVFYDRAGDFQEFIALRVTPDMIALFFEIGQRRVAQVADAQELFERTGNLGMIHQLRDMTPSFCFSPKVMCPLRERCWGGSQWDDETPLEGAELSSSVDRYIEGRRLAKLGDGMKKAAREELKGITGKFEDGRMVTWAGNTINVVETAKGKAAATARKAELELRPAPAAESSSSDVVSATLNEMADELVAQLEENVLLPGDQGMPYHDLPGRDPRIEHVQFRDSETGEVADLPGKTMPPAIADSVARLREMQRAAEARKRQS